MLSYCGLQVCILSVCVDKKRYCIKRNKLYLTNPLWQKCIRQCPLLYQHAEVQLPIRRWKKMSWLFLALCSVISFRPPASPGNRPTWQGNRPADLSKLEDLRQSSSERLVAHLQYENTLEFMLSWFGHGWRRDPVKAMNNNKCTSNKLFRKCCSAKKFVSSRASKTNFVTQRYIWYAVLSTKIIFKLNGSLKSTLASLTSDFWLYYDKIV